VPVMAAVPLRRKQWRKENILPGQNQRRCKTSFEQSGSGIQRTPEPGAYRKQEQKGERPPQEQAGSCSPEREAVHREDVGDPRGVKVWAW